MVYTSLGQRHDPQDNGRDRGTADDNIHAGASETLMQPAADLAHLAELATCLRSGVPLAERDRVVVAVVLEDAAERRRPTLASRLRREALRTAKGSFPSWVAVLSRRQPSGPIAPADRCGQALPRRRMAASPCARRTTGQHRREPPRVVLAGVQGPPAISTWPAQRREPARMMPRHSWLAEVRRNFWAVRLA